MSTQKLDIIGEEEEEESPDNINKDTKFGNKKA